MNILITGISGRIGANLAKALVEAGHQVRGLVWPRDRRPEKLAGLPVELVEGSLVNPTEVDAAVAGTEAICHLGAAFQGGGPFSATDYFEINVRGTFNMLEAAQRQGDRLQHFFFASTDAIYDKYLPNGVPEPIREDHFPLTPRGHYALSKQLGEDLCRGYARNEGLPVTIFRFALTVAGDEILDFRQFYLDHWREVYSKLAGPDAEAVVAELEGAAAKHGRQALLLARDAQGRSYKKHIADVHDIVAGFLAALGKPEAVGQTFQLAAPRAFTWEEAIPYLAEKLGLPYVDVRLAGHTPTYYEFDLSKGARLLGYRPSYDIFRMIDEGMALRQGRPVDVVPTYAARRS
ncbi:MAG TPA: NAD(P)-dependent oxidoreductase [Caldilineaceae bacterium]|nr:NAD(P)-dependent oxidoreductase [Caldilineaceae bacterium]